MRLINAESLYKKVASWEEETLKELLKHPRNSEKYKHYNYRLNAIAEFKHMIVDEQDFMKFDKSKYRCSNVIMDSGNARIDIEKLEKRICMDYVKMHEPCKIVEMLGELGFEFKHIKE